MRVLIDVPSNLRGLRIPALLIQPLVENSINHGISPQRAGGEVVILARMSRGDANQTFADDTLQIWVRDTGAGASEIVLENGRRRGVALSPIEKRPRSDPVSTSSTARVFPKLNELAGLVIRQRLQQDAIDHAENRRVGATAQRQCEHGYQGETRILHQHPRAKAQVLYQRFHSDSSFAFDQLQ